MKRTLPMVAKLGLTLTIFMTVVGCSPPHEVVEQLQGVWKANCAKWGNPARDNYSTITLSLTETNLEMLLEVYAPSANCKANERWTAFTITVRYSVGDLVQDIPGAYNILGTIQSVTVTVYENPYAVSNEWRNKMNIYEYDSGWEYGVPRDVAGRIREPGAFPEPNIGDPLSVAQITLFKIEGEKLWLGVKTPDGRIALQDTVFIRQSGS